MNSESYLNLDELLHLQHPKTTDPLEMVFIVAHQTSELWFKVLIQELTQLIEVPKDKHPNISNKPVVLTGYGQEYNPTIQLQRIVKIFKHLQRLWDILATISPAEYERFRPELDDAFSKQSVQYIKIEPLLHKLISRWHYKYDQQLVDVESSFKLWQFVHLKTVERIVGDKPILSGMQRSIDYLRRNLDHPLRVDQYWNGMRRSS